jgi:hypothetical protein
MIVRIQQRSKDDCAICAVAMVMGSPYSYERVQSDSNKYSKINENVNSSHGGSSPCGSRGLKVSIAGSTAFQLD